MPARWRTLAVATALAGCAREPAPDRPERARNVVLVTLDTVRADGLGCYGNPRGLTPCLDELARRGTRFERAAAPMPETGPSHATILSGRYPFSHGLMTNFVSLNPEVETLGQRLLQRGFATGAFVNIFPFGEAKLTRGFQRLSRDMDPQAAHVAPSLRAWLDELPREKPFFAWIHYYVAHTPFEPPQRLVDRFVPQPYRGPADFSAETRMRIHTGQQQPPDGYAQGFRQLYDAEIAFVDERVREMVQVLEERALMPETLLVVTADHGESLDDRMLGLHAHVVRQSTLHVPLFLVGPGVAAGETVPDVVELVDLCPTILEALQVDVPEPVQGRSLWPLLRREPIDWNGRAFGSLPTLIEEQRADRLPGTLTHWAEPWKLVVTGQGEEARTELYNLEQDPDERVDVAAAHPEIVRSMRRALDDWVERTRRDRLPAGETLPRFEATMRALGYTK